MICRGALLLVLLCASPAFAQATHSLELLNEASAEIIPRYLLQDPNGRSVTSEDFRGRFQLISFGYTYCPDICPTTLVEMAEILKQLGDSAVHVQPIFISVDPERDTGKILKTYTEFFDPRILGLTASPALVRRAADNFKIRYAKVLEPGTAPDRYAVDHSAGMILLGPDGAFIKKFAFAMPVTNITEQLRNFIKSP
ncbi:MAG: SCO family protein [Dechloromonas sp.]|nr:SCO family protein [Dechloromonas sp.]